MVNPEFLAGSIQIDAEFKQKLARKGMTAEEYFGVANAFRACDRKKIESMIEVDDPHVLTTKQQFYDETKGEYAPDREHFHRNIVDYKIFNKPILKQPIFSIIAGPPGAGKSTLRDTVINHRDVFVSTDPDRIRPLLIDDYDEADLEKILKTREEAFDVSQKLFDYCFEQGYSISCESTLRDSNWILEALNTASKKGYEVTLDFLHRPLDECYFNDVFKRKKSVPLKLFIDSIDGYANFFALFNNQNIQKASMYNAEGVYTNSITPLIQREGSSLITVDRSKVQNVMKYIHGFKI